MNKVAPHHKKIVEVLSHCSDIDNAEEYYRFLVSWGENTKKLEDILFLHSIFEALANIDRLVILYSLMEKDRCVCELQAIVSKAQSSISRDLKLLEQARLIRGWKKGKFTHYSLVKSTFTRFMELIDSLPSQIKNWFEEL